MSRARKFSWSKGDTPQTFNLSSLSSSSSTTSSSSTSSLPNPRPDLRPSWGGSSEFSTPSASNFLALGAMDQQVENSGMKRKNSQIFNQDYNSEDEDHRDNDELHLQPLSTQGDQDAEEGSVLNPFMHRVMTSTGDEETTLRKEGMHAASVIGQTMLGPSTSNSRGVMYRKSLDNAEGYDDARERRAFGARNFEKEDKYSEKLHRWSLENTWICSKLVLRVLLVLAVLALVFDKVVSRTSVAEETVHLRESVVSVEHHPQPSREGEETETKADKPLDPPPPVNDHMKVKDILKENQKYTAALAKRIDALESDLAQQRKENQGLLERMYEKLTATATKSAVNASHDLLVKSLYDNSNVHLAVLENLEVYGAKRWVVPCEIDSGDCRVASQTDVFVQLLGSLAPDKRRKQDKEKYRIVQVGLCDPNILEATLSKLGDRVARFTIVEGALDSHAEGDGELCGGHNAGTKEFQDTLERLQKEYKTVSISVLTETDLVKASNTFDQKYFDAVILDQPPPLPDDDMQSVFNSWFLRLRNDGFILGHGYGPLTLLSDNGTPSVPVTWLQDKKLSREQLQSVKTQVDSFVQTVKEKSDSLVHVAGDTVWYMFRRKMSLANVFN